MLKKIVHIVFCLLLIVATTGFTISKHYCGNKLLSVSLFDGDKCMCVGPCKDCHTNIKQIKVSDNYSISEVLHPKAPVSAFAILIYNTEFSPLASIAIGNYLFEYKDPPPCSQSLFILHQSFLC